SIYSVVLHPLPHSFPSSKSLSLLYDQFSFSSIFSSFISDQLSIFSSIPFCSIVFWASSAAANRKPSSPKKAKKAMKIKNKNKTAITTVTIVLTIVVHLTYHHIKNRTTRKNKIKNNTITQLCSYYFSIDSASPIEFLLISFIQA